MPSQIQKLIGLKNNIVAAANGKIAAFSAETTTCTGGRAGLGFEKYPLGWIEYFLSCGNENVPRCEHYKRTPEFAREFITKISNAICENAKNFYSWKIARRKVS